MERRTAALHNLGCKVNAYETDAMQELLAGAGYEIVPFDGPADVYVVNTCTVTNIADRKSRQMLHRCKKKNPESVLVAVGCYVQTSFEEAAADPDIDIILGNNEKSRIVEAIETHLADRAQKVILRKDMNELTDYEPMQIHVTSGDRTRAFLKIQDGCNRFCSYCMIPYARGRVRSAELRSVVKEVQGLANAGYKEIVLNGIHLASFGQQEGTNLVELLEMLERVEGIERIRLGSLEPGFITEESAARMGKLSKLCPHFHLSLQSGCDSVLQRMNRKYTTAEYKEKCELLRRHFDHPAFTTDIIVGFPQETEEEFETTLEFVKEIGFYEVHVFKYSIRKGTKAATMSGQLSEAQKGVRSDRLIQLCQEQKEAFERSFDGNEAEVLIEEMVEIDGKIYAKGHTRHYMEVYCETAADRKGQIVNGTLQCRETETQTTKYRMNFLI